MPKEKHGNRLKLCTNACQVRNDHGTLKQDIICTDTFRSVILNMF